MNDAERENPLNRLFDDMPTNTRLRPFDNDRHFGVEVAFVETGFGFGAFTLSVEKATGRARFDDDGVEIDHCAQIIMRHADEIEALRSRCSRYEEALRRIADMPSYDQDDEHRLRDHARRALTPSEKDQ